MNQIAAVDRNWAIGKEGKLLVSIPEDMKFFRAMTKGKTVIMGRKTLQSFPGGRPLKGRRNIVLTGQEGIEMHGAEKASSIREALDMVCDEDPDDVFIIGGSSVYEAFLPFCETCYITKIDNEFDADTWYPDLDKDEDWEIADISGGMEYEGIRFCFVTYRRIRPSHA